MKMLILVLLLCGLLAACGDDDDKSQGLVGTWSGSISDALDGSGNFTATVTEHQGNIIIGSFSTTFGGITFSGTFDGELFGQRLVVRFAAIAGCSILGDGPTTTNTMSLTATNFCGSGISAATIFISRS